MDSAGHSFHNTHYGQLGKLLPCDRDGFVPAAKTGPWDLNFEHEEPTHHGDGTLTGYGRWWETERWPEIAAKAMEWTEVIQMGMGHVDRNN